MQHSMSQRTLKNKYLNRPSIFSSSWRSHAAPADFSNQHHRQCFSIPSECPPCSRTSNKTSPLPRCSVTRTYPSNESLQFGLDISYTHAAKASSALDARGPLCLGLPSRGYLRVTNRVQPPCLIHSKHCSSSVCSYTCCLLK